MKLHKSITDLLRKSYDLIYIDYRESLDGHDKEFEKAVQSQDWSPIDEILDGWEMWERESDSVDYILKELTGEIESAFDTTGEKAESFVEKYKDYLRDEIYNRDSSTPLKDLLRNTQDSICYYDTGYEVENQTWSMNQAEFKQEIKNIKKALKIKIKDTTWDNQIVELLQNASYGGRLLIFFGGEIESLMKIKENGYKRVKFENMEVGLIDYCNGSGHNVNFNGAKLTLPLDVQNIGFDLTHRYNYTNAVCGMIHSWCDGTNVKLTK